MFQNSQWQSAQLFTHRRQTLTLLHLFTDLFHKEILQNSTELTFVFYVISMCITV